MVSVCVAPQAARCRLPDAERSAQACEQARQSGLQTLGLEQLLRVPVRELDCLSLGRSTCDPTLGASWLRCVRETCLPMSPPCRKSSRRNAYAFSSTRHAVGIWPPPALKSRGSDTCIDAHPGKRPEQSIRPRGHPQPFQLPTPHRGQIDISSSAAQPSGRVAIR